MNEFRKHDFRFFSSKEELRETLTRMVASIMFKSINEGVSIDEFSRIYLKMLLIDAVRQGINPTFLVKDRLEMLLDDDVDTAISLFEGGKAEDLTMEEVFEMWKEELEQFKGMSEQEIYDVISNKHD